MTHSSKHHLLALLASVLGGALMAIQARVNGELGSRLEDGIFAALVSFGSGLVLLSIALALRKDVRQRLSTLLASMRSGAFPIWGALGGALGGYFVITQGLTTAALSVSIFTIAVIAGQALAALLIDGRGLMGMAKRRLSPLRLSGTSLSLIGLVLAVGIGAEINLLALLPALAGVGMGFQQALNGRLGQELGSPVAATFLNFLVGTAVIFIAHLVFVGAQIPNQWPSNPIIYIGGTIGVAFIFAQVIVVRIIGTLALGVAILVGQVVMALILDIWFPISSREIGPITFAGIALVVLGGLLVTLRR